MALFDSSAIRKKHVRRENSGDRQHKYPRLNYRFNNNRRFSNSRQTSSSPKQNIDALQSICNVLQSAQN